MAKQNLNMRTTRPKKIEVMILEIYIYIYIQHTIHYRANVAIFGYVPNLQEDPHHTPSLTSNQDVCHAPRCAVSHSGSCARVKRLAGFGSCCVVWQPQKCLESWFQRGVPLRDRFGCVVTFNREQYTTWKYIDGSSLPLVLVGVILLVTELGMSSDHEKQDGLVHTFWGC